jgi:hypothetical protein
LSLRFRYRCRKAACGNNSYHQKSKSTHQFTSLSLSLFPRTGKPGPTHNPASVP